MTAKEQKSLIEAVLFVSAEPVSLATIKGLLELPEPEALQLVGEIMQDYRLRDSGIIMVEVAGGYQMTTNPACAGLLRKFLNVTTANRLSLPALETLAIIAYKQPIIKAEIEQIRGVNADGVIKTLHEKRLIKIIGRKEVPGKPLLYGTTREFLEYFGLRDLTELPTLKDLAREEAA